MILGLGSLLNKLILNRFIYGSNVFFASFSTLFSGYLLLASGSAIYYSNGITLQWLMLIGVVFWLLNVKKKLKTEVQIKPQFSLVNVLAMSFASLVSFFIIFWVSGFPNASVNIDVYYDLFYYGKLSSSLINDGFENRFALLNHYVHQDTSNLYHYTDLWYTGFLSKIFNANEIEILLFSNYSVLLFIIFIACIGVLQQNLNWHPLFLLLITLLALYGLSLKLPLNDFTLYRKAYYTFNGCPGFTQIDSKTLILIPFFLLAFYELKSKDVFAFFLFLLMAMVAYNTIIPALCGGIALSFLYFAYLYFVKKQLFINLDSLLKRSSFLIAGFLVLFVFYVLQVVDEKNVPLEIEFLSIKSSLIVFIEYLVYPWFVYFILLITLTHALFLKHDRFFTRSSVFLVIGCQIAGTLFIILNHDVGDVFQALSNVIHPLFLVLFIFKIHLLKAKKFNFLLIGIVLLISLVSNVYNKSENNVVKKPIFNKQYSYSFKTKVLDVLLENAPHNNWATLSSLSSPHWFYSWAGIGHFLLSKKEIPYPFDLSQVISEDFTKWCNKETNFQSPFCQGNFIKPYDVSLLNFIKEKQVLYLFVEKKSLIPAYLEKNLTLLYKDQTSGHLFYAIKTTQKH